MIEFHQTFHLIDCPRIFVLAFLEIALSADNAIVLGVLIRHLPDHLRRRALFIGIISAFFLRATALVTIGFLFRYRWIQLVGAAYLIYLSFSHLIQSKKTIKSPRSFWKTVLLIEFLDLIFALDSIVAGLAFIDENLTKLWIVYTGGMIGLVGIRFGAEFFSRLLNRFPRLELSAYLLVGWIGFKLALDAIGYSVPPSLFWAVNILIFLRAFFQKKR